MTVCCLCHASIIMPSAIRLELSKSRVALSQVSKMSLRTPDPLYTQSYVKVWARDYSQMCYTVPGLYPNCVLNLHLRYPCTFAYSQTGKTFRNFFKFTLLLPITKASLPPVSMTMFSFGVQRASNWFTNKL